VFVKATCNNGVKGPIGVFIPKPGGGWNVQPGEGLGA
jgi:hypothetical protein